MYCDWPVSITIVKNAIATVGKVILEDNLLAAHLVDKFTGMYKRKFISVF